MPDNPVKLGVLLSGTGRSLQNLIDRIAAGTLTATVRCVIASRDGCKGSEIARRGGIPSFVERDATRIWGLLRAHGVELVCLAGYMRLLPIAPDYDGAVLNIHPALLPKFGGKGFHGDRVHRAVLEAGDAESGCTVHYCNNRYDDGTVLVQRRVPVLPDDTAAELAARVFDAECEAYPEAIQKWVAARSADRSTER